MKQRTKQSGNDSSGWFARNSRTAVNFLALALFSIALVGLLMPPLSTTRHESSIIVGKDYWLFPAWVDLTDAGLDGIRNSVSLIAAANRALEARQVRLLVVVTPMKARIYEQQLPAGMRLSPAVKGRYEAILDLLHKAGIATIDAGAIADQLKSKGEAVYYRTDQTWTAMAAEATAKAAARFISSHWPLPHDPARAVAPGQWTTSLQAGDLIKFLPAGQRTEAGRDKVTIRTGGNEKGLILFRGGAPIYVLGDSFVAPFTGFAQYMSHNLQTPVSLQWQTGSMGPWANFLLYVESNNFSASPPRVVVWQFNEGQLPPKPDEAGMWDPKGIMTAKEWLRRLHVAVSG